jgi:hypothetical protein
MINFNSKVIFKLGYQRSLVPVFLLKIKSGGFPDGTGWPDV